MLTHQLHLRFAQSLTLARVILPVEQHLVLDEVGGVRVDQFVAELLLLQQLQQVEALWVAQVAHVGRRAPVPQVGEVVHKARVLAGARGENV